MIATIVAFIGITLSVHAGSILREVYQGTGGGTAISDLTNASIYPDHPTLTNLVTDFFESPSNFDENYGQRMRGYVVPPVSGSYTFWLATDDNGALFLSTDDNPVNRKLIATVSSWVPPRVWEQYAEQKSAPVTLQAGKAYYVEALMKEGGGGDNLAVRWLRPDGADEGPIPATYLLPWGVSFTPPIITQQPTNTTVVEGQTATFSIGVKNLDLISYQWSRNGAVIPGATGSIYSFGPVTLADNGATFSAILTNKLGATNTTVATLAVTPDVTPPKLTNVVNLGPTTIRLQFDEAVSTSTATVPGNYSVGGGVTVTSAAFGADNQTILLTMAPLTYGTTYTVTAKNIQDRAQTPNTIAPGSQLSFLALEFVSADIGGSGSIQRLGPGAYDVNGGGADIGGGKDQFQFAWELRSGNFDVQTRVAGVAVTDPFLRVGLMARGTLDASSAFAGVFGSSAQAGCFFESRGATGATATNATFNGGFPVNYPQTWLRLRRAGNTFTGFASLDGVTWVQLGTATITLPGQLYVGLAVTSGNASTSTSAQFRDYGNTTSTTTGTFTRDREPLGPTSRHTGLVFSEIMYHPKAIPGSTNNLEFVEIYNADSIFEDIGGWQIQGGISYTFPPGFRLAAGDFVVIAADPAALKAAYGIDNVLGPCTGALNNAGDTIKLVEASGAIKLDLSYSPSAPWPVAADGTGHSLSLLRPSYGEADPRAWGASEAIGGSPGGLDTLLSNPQRGVVINEFLAHTDEPLVDYIELYNSNNAPVDLSGCYLTDDASTNKFRIAAGTTIPARGFLAFDQNQLGFSLDAKGESLFLVNSNATRVIDALSFEAQENGVAS
ncbi:MAG TPA: lamin tail domain-containing protein, partial [Verrucomicrobiae bacterium]|nr:lamin tail domain-containing protein [Verrucomicrobiae bacterium]